MAARLETEFLGTGELAAWAAIVRRSEHGTLFHSAHWTDVIASAFERRGRILGVFRNGTLVGGCPVYERRTLGLSISNPPVVAGYAGALIDTPESKRPGKVDFDIESALGALEAGLRARYHLSRVVQCPGVDDARPFQWSGWRVTPRFTFRLSLQDPEGLLGTFEENVRNKIKKAERAGLTVQRIARTEEIISAYQRSYGRHGTPPPVPREPLRKLADRLLDEGIARGYVTRSPDGTAHAFKLQVSDERKCYAWVAGSVPEHLSEGGFSLLTWKIMCDFAKTHGSYDFMGANTPTIARFKRAFGGELVPYWEGFRGTAWARTLRWLRHAGAPKPSR